MRGYHKEDITLKPLIFSTLSQYDRAYILSSLAIFVFSFVISYSKELHYSVYLFYLSLFLFFSTAFFSFFQNKKRHLSHKVFLLYETTLFVIIVVLFFFYIYNHESKNLLLLSVMLALLMVMPYLFITLAKKILTPLLYHKVLRYGFFEVEKNDFFTSDVDYDIAIQKDKRTKNYDVVFLLNTQMHASAGEDFKRLKENFAKIIYFWYAYKYERVYLRFILPMWSIFFGILFFVATLATLDALTFPKANNVIKMLFVVLFLTLLFIVMIYQINTTLDPKAYLNHIIKEFKRLHINFKDALEPAQKFFIFLDANFLIFIYDKKYDRKLVLNKSKSFEHFILRAELDREGRDNIASVLVTLLILVYLEIFVQVLADSKTDEKINKIYKLLQEHNTTLHTISKTIKDSP